MFGDQVVLLVAGAFSVGPVTRTDPWPWLLRRMHRHRVFEVLLRLPERSYHDVFDLRGQLMTGIDLAGGGCSIWCRGIIWGLESSQ